LPLIQLDNYIKHGEKIKYPLDISLRKFEFRGMKSFDYVIERKKNAKIPNFPHPTQKLQKKS